ncbi:DNA polymerase-1 [Lipingzhangella halophila]|uniref:DNA-directed DNA polymerase n=1 Tax=Lipingzhangella halophila TaxID=1783352 RepID=A0A7W7RE10_9ACTN|nr:bifunctional 3'-5' exonuclease/DNA polymerase [Lipingzhangella halophila]MBB4930159.1 DNA polymerase-1 [Lipingzhangella halophila]
MRIAVAADGEGGGRLWEVDPAPGGKAGRGSLWRVSDLAGAIADLERFTGARPRWIWAATDELYPALIEHSLRVARCHDIGLVESLLLGYDGRFGEPSSLGAAWARLHGRAVPSDIGQPASMGATSHPALFEPDRSTVPAGVDRLDALLEVYADQQRRIAQLPHPERFSLLAAVESAGALAAAEMAHDGVPWRADLHDATLTEYLGERPIPGERPPVLADLAARISEAFGRTVNPDSPTQLMKAFAAIGHPVPSTRSWVLRQVDHPVVPLLLRYKELSRLHSTHGWAWLENWVRHGRFRPDYVVGGVVSGRWATRGGGALQIPKTVRRAVCADPDWTFVCADAGQLEPRILAAVSGDDALAEAAGTSDLYATLADRDGGDRERAKIAMLAAMYGQMSGDATWLRDTMHRMFPKAMDYVDAAAQAGENGSLVRSWLGRTCPPPARTWRAVVFGDPGDDDVAPDTGTAGEDAGARAARGRFTRNFVIQATAAEWALVLMAAVRRRLAELDTVHGVPQLVLFQHDELVLHVPLPLAESVVSVLRDAGEETRTLMFGDTAVRFPLDVSIVTSYADA